MFRPKSNSSNTNNSSKSSVLNIEHTNEMRQVDVYVLGGYVQIKSGMPSESISIPGSYREVSIDELQAALVDACNDPFLSLAEKQPNKSIDSIRMAIFLNQLTKEDHRQCFPPNKSAMRKYSEGEFALLTNLVNDIIEIKPFFQYFRQWCQNGFLAFRSEIEASQVAKTFRYVSVSDGETYIPALYRATCLNPESVNFKQYADNVCCAPMQWQGLCISAGKALYYADNDEADTDLLVLSNTVDFVQINSINITKTVYVLSELICLNRGNNLEISNTINSDELCNVFPNSSRIQVYSNLDEAKAVQRTRRIQELVDVEVSFIQGYFGKFDEKGFDYRPRLASVIFITELKKAMAFYPSSKVYEIDFECIDKSSTVQVINCEKEKDFPAENMPKSIDISNLERKIRCTIC